MGEGWVFWDDDGEEYSTDHPDARGSTVEQLRRSTTQEDHLYRLWQAALSPSPGVTDKLVGLQIEARPMHENYAVLAEITPDGAKTIAQALAAARQTEEGA